MNIFIDYYPIGITLILCASFLAMLGLRILRKIIPEAVFSSLQDSTGNFFQVVGTLYAVLLGLIVTDAIGKYLDAEKDISGEAGALVAIYELSNQIVPKEKGHQIQVITSEYLDEIISTDWQNMQEDTDNYKARKKLRSLLEAIQSIEPVSENNKAIFSLLLDRILDATDLRRMRIDSAREGIPAAEWACLWISTLATLISGYFFQIKSRKAHEFCILIMTFVAATNLYMIMLFGEPYKGQFLASKQPLETAQKVLHGSYYGP